MSGLKCHVEGHSPLGLALWALVLCLLLGQVSGECPNACNGKGRCLSRDVCSCYKGYMGNDCGQRLCQYGRAHVDVAKGDLNGDGIVSGPSVTVLYGSQVYPYGTTEEFPRMTDSWGQALANTAHDYAECSNKGHCNRILGVCQCVDGYEGSACQYASCPNHCSGHGVCVTARDLAELNGGITYELWDTDSTLGCHCDPGYFGPDCSESRCKAGYDPLFLFPGNSFRYANWSVVIAHKAGQSMPVVGNYSLVFYDEKGQDWHTDPISYGATCKAVIRALEGLPNRAIPAGSVRCTAWSDFGRITFADEPMFGAQCSQFYGCLGNLRIKPGVYSGVKYTLAFPGNPGVVKPPEVNWFLDGNRPTLATQEFESTLSAFVYANGFTGEYKEYFPYKCLGVDVTLVTIAESPTQPTSTVLGGLTSLEFRYLASCLGSSDELTTFDATVAVNGQTYQWDYGTVTWPHLVRLVDETPAPTTDLCNSTSAVENGYPKETQNGGRSSVELGRFCVADDPPPGFFVALYYDAASNLFRLLNRPGEDYSSTTKFSVFTTKGTVCMVSAQAKVFTDNSHPYSTTVYTTNSSNAFPGYQGNVDCPTNLPLANGAIDCIDRGDLVFFLDPTNPANNPKYINLHTVQRTYNANKNLVAVGSSPGLVRIVLESAMTSTWANADLTVTGRVYKFKPPDQMVDPSAVYPYVAECSNRGLCVRTGDSSGQCMCGVGYTGDDCSIHDNLFA